MLGLYRLASKHQMPFKSFPQDANGSSLTTTSLPGESDVDLLRHNTAEQDPVQVAAANSGSFKSLEIKI